jgi:hypothetical protein
VLDHRVLGWIAITLLGVAFMLRVIQGFRERRTPSPPDSVPAARDD